MENALPGFATLKYVFKYLHGGALAHSSSQVENYLNGNIPDRCIGRNGPIRQPARASDVNPLDFYLWGYMESKVYTSTNGAVFLLTAVVDI